MTIFYNDNAERANKNASRRFRETDPHEAYLLHFGRALILRKRAKDRAIKFEDRCDVERELQVAERKLRFWSTRADFRWAEVEAVTEMLKRTLG